MSRIGKASIPLEPGVNVSVTPQNSITVKGPKGLLTMQIPPEFSIKVEHANCSVSTQKTHPSTSAAHGLYRALLANMVTGVTKGYTLTLELIGIGYKADIKKSAIELELGYSHSIFFVLPEEITAKVEIRSDKVNVIHLAGIDKQLLGQVAAKLKSLRKVEPYKGKGIRISGEFVRRKAGKSQKK